MQRRPNHCMAESLHEPIGTLCKLGFSVLVGSIIPSVGTLVLVIAHAQFRSLMRRFDHFLRYW